MVDRPEGALIFVLLLVVKSEKHPEFRNRYLRIKKRRGHKKAIIAICRMILTAIYHMFQTGELYNAEHYRKAEVLPVDRDITIEQAILIAVRKVIVSVSKSLPNF